MKNYDKAIECCEKAVDINPNDGMSWYNEACYLTLIGKIDDGLDALKKSVRDRHPERPQGSARQETENPRAEEGLGSSK